MFNQYNSKYSEGQEVYCKISKENVFIKHIGEISYFCVKSLKDNTGFYYSEEDLNEI